MDAGGVPEEIEKFLDPRDGCALLNSDLDLRDIRASVDGDADAYARLMCRYEPLIFMQMSRFTRDRRSLEELVQEVQVEVYYSLAKYRDIAPLQHWLRRIATRVGYRYWKRENRARKRREILKQEWKLPEPVAYMEPSEAGVALFGMLERLPPRDRLVLTLYYFEECDTTEIAERIGWSVGLVRVQMHRARLKLRRMLAEAGYGKDNL